MHHLHSLDEARLDSSSVVTIGVFDGVHRGHQYLLSRLVQYAHDIGMIPAVLTFYPYPDLVIKGYKSGYYLTLPDTKARLLEGLGVEVVITHTFDDNVRHMRAQSFLDALITKLRTASLWVGADFAFGYQREGNIEFLAAQARERGFDLRIIDLMDGGNGERVSSSRIRAELAEGNVEAAAHLLGRPHQITGTVTTGAGRGRTIGIPTANLSVTDELAIPARGVYAAYATVNSRRVPAVVNIGVRPTFDGQAKQMIEAHLLDFSGDLYGMNISLDFVSRLRSEQKFASANDLVTQIHRDIERGREILDPTG